ncbi:MAG: AAA family ATPase [Syntrophomonadaceae bacterium]|nr:AAA family ATPase [Syntrophomonadaceae bacterium]
MSDIITIATQKGGTGKTTTAGALGAALTRKGWRVLMVDMDPQANLTFTMRAQDQTHGTYEVLTGKMPAADAICTGPGQAGKPSRTKEKPGDMPDRKIIPASTALSGADLELTAIGKEFRLQEALQPLRDDFDYIIIDTPPSLGILTINALTAADEVVITAQADAYSLQGIWQLHSTIQAVTRYTNPGLLLKGILITRHNPRSVLSRDLTGLIEETAQQMQTFVYQRPIREGVAVKEAQASRQDLFSYAPRNKPAQDYMAFADELLERRQGDDS